MSDNEEVIFNDVIKESIAKADKRKATSKANMAKARLTKIANQKKAREVAQNTVSIYEETDSDSEDESDDEQELVLTKRAPKGKVSKTKAPKKQLVNNEMSEIKSMMSQLIQAQLKAKKKKPAKKQINVQLPAYPTAPKTNNPQMDQLKQNLIAL